MGIHADWRYTYQWLNPNREKPSLQPVAEPIAEKKYPEIPKLSNYRLPAPAQFWDYFPSRPVPQVPVTPIDSEILWEEVQSRRHLLSPSQIARAETTCAELKLGVHVPFINPLPAIKTPNSASVYEHGESFTDTLAGWVKRGFVSGPFLLPPYPDFRANAMLAVEQKGKVRIVMDLSSPKDFSYNDAIQDCMLEKIFMSSAKRFGYSLIDCGYNARMWKFDMADAYKNMPAAIKDIRCQGFAWLGANFVETQEPFGSEAAVSGYDRLGHTMAVLPAVDCGFPATLTHRTLDDLPFVTPVNSDLGIRYAAGYKTLCENVGIKLADNCPYYEKAFEDSTRGTVLGIVFDTTTMLWSISTDKYARIINRIIPAFQGSEFGLNQVQKLLGTLNDFGQMCPFVKGFRHPLHIFLQSFNEDEYVKFPVPAQVQRDLMVWTGAIEAAKHGLPIPHRPPFESPTNIIFVSDAAGAQFRKEGDRFIPFGPSGDRGGASISMDPDGTVWFCARVSWPDNFLFTDRDSKDHAYGCKSTTLEIIALILPFLCIPQLIAGKNITLLTDNEAVVYGWESRRVNNDVSASIFMRSLHLISFYLGNNISILHLPRMSTPAAELADALSRKSTTGPAQREAISGSRPHLIPRILTDWLRSPREDWEFAFEILNHVTDTAQL